MGFFDYFRGLPAWAEAIPANIRPSRPLVHRLEQYRQEAGVDHEAFFEAVTCHPESSRRLYRTSYQTFKQSWPAEPEARLLQCVLMGYLGSLAMYGVESMRFRGAVDSETTEAAIREFRHLESLIDAIMEDRSRILPPVAGNDAEHQRRIGEILQGQ